MGPANRSRCGGGCEEAPRGAEWSGAEKRKELQVEQNEENATRDPLVTSKGAFAREISGLGAFAPLKVVGKRPQTHVWRPGQRGPPVSSRGRRKGQTEQ